MLADERDNPIYSDIIVDFSNMSYLNAAIISNIWAIEIKHYLNKCSCKVDYMDETPLIVDLLMTEKLEYIRPIILN